MNPHMHEYIYMCASPCVCGQVRMRERVCVWGGHQCVDTRVCGDGRQCVGTCMWVCVCLRDGMKLTFSNI